MMGSENRTRQLARGLIFSPRLRTALFANSVASFLESALAGPTPQVSSAACHRAAGIITEAIIPRSSANRNVWSAALSQAKNEVTGGSAQMYSAFVGAQGSWP